MNNLKEFGIINFFNYGQFDLIRCSDKLKFNSVLDVGFGLGGASIYFAMQEKKVTSIGLSLDSYEYPKEALSNLNINTVESSVENFKSNEKFDAIWASHVLEHTQNTGLFLNKLKSLLNDDGWLMIVVPGYDPRILGGHINIGWTLGSLMYNLLIAGFDIKNGHFINDKNAITAFVRKSNKKLPILRMDNGDIETTASLWPIDIKQGDDGSKLLNVNWFDDYEEIIKTQYNVEKFSRFLYQNLLKETKVKNKINSFFEKYKDKDIYFYGAGYFAQELVKTTNLPSNVKGFFDKNKAGEKIGSFDILSPSEVEGVNPDVLAISMPNSDRVLADLEKYNSLIIPDFLKED